MMELGEDYIERVYAGVLGKIIGVYHGRPVENWSHREIVARFGEVRDFVAPQTGRPIVVPDDDISGTFTFIRAMSDNGNPLDLTPRQVGDTWLNYIIENRAILWWGGMGQSTEHTAFLHLKNGIHAPESGSATRNGVGLSEQIGAQIFIEGFGLIAPGDPERAAHLARVAASVSHDGEAIHGAQVVAAMVAAAFMESRVDALIDAGMAVVPESSAIAETIREVRAWYAADGDWYTTRDRIERKHGHDAWPGHVHIVPNHAVVILALIAGGGDFAQSLMIASTAGFDTDCNAANVGAVLGVARGLDAMTSAIDFRTPVNDRLYLPTADGGAAITDAVRETAHLVNISRSLAGRAAWQPDGGARFHFALPGSTQGFVIGGNPVNSTLTNHDHALSAQVPPGTHEITTPVFLSPAETDDLGYRVLASPTLYPGQRVTARVRADRANAADIDVHPLVRAYDASDELKTIAAPSQRIRPGATAILKWTVPSETANPLADVGVGIVAGGNAIVDLDYLTWDGDPTVTLALDPARGRMCGLAWINGVDLYRSWFDGLASISQNAGTGLVLQGTRLWADYRATATIRPLGHQRFGIVIRAQGMRRYYALIARRDGIAQLVRRIDDEEIVLGSFEAELAEDTPYVFVVEASGTTIRASIEGIGALTATDDHPALRTGSAGFLVTSGTIHCAAVEIRALGADT